MKIANILMTLGALAGCAWALPQASSVDAAKPVAKEHAFYNYSHLRSRPKIRFALLSI